MKLLLYFLLAFCVSIKLYSQNPQLLNNDWYLHAVTINGQTYLEPGLETPRVEVSNFFKNPGEFATGYCNIYGVELTYLPNDSFNILTVVVLSDNCNFPESMQFDSHYYNFLEGFSTNLNPYSYMIFTENSETFLEITNAVGNTALYGTTALGVVDFLKDSISIFPNPATNELTVTLNNNPLENILIFNLQGQKVMTVSFQLNEQAIDISNLQSGVYFLKAKSDTGRQFVAKFVKQ